MIGNMRVYLGVCFLLVALTSVAGSPVHYIENKNQWPSGFRFGADFPQMKVMLKDASIFFVQYAQAPDDNKSSKGILTTAPNEGHVHGTGEMSVATFELKFIGALQASITRSNQQKTKYNYYNGSDRSDWATGVAAYSDVVYNEIYRGIDLRVYSENSQMKYDWIVSPCADAREIKFKYKGVEHIELRNENLVVETKLGEVVETKPYAYQLVNGKRRAVAVAFDIDDGEASFIFPNGYDTNYELVIDPFLVFSSYSGSTLDNWGNTATPDLDGNLYSGGMVSAEFFGEPGFPTTPGAFQVRHKGGVWDVGILKYDSVGSDVLYVTYLGGRGVETPQSLVVNNNNELLVLGATSSGNFPGTAGGFKGGSRVDPLGGIDYTGGTDLFIARFSEDGSQLLAARYIGGSANDGINFVSGRMAPNTPNEESPLGRNYGDQLRGDIITDANGFVYIASNTRSADFPLVNTDTDAQWHGGTHDGVVAKFTSNLKLVWSRLIGGSGTDAAYSIKITPSGNILVGGGTTSANLSGMTGNITHAPGNIDGWIAEISPEGDRFVNGTYVGTSSYDQVYFIDQASNGDILAYGQTMGKYPIVPSTGIFSNPNSGQFLHRFTFDLKSTVFSTTFGKGNQSPDISPTAFLVNDCDMIYMAGWGGRVNATERFDMVRNYVGGDTFGLPVTPDAWQPSTFGDDFYMMVLSGDATEIIYATYLGGTESFVHVDGGTSRFDKRGVVYHAVCAGCGGRPNDFPSYNVPPSRSENRSSNCNNAAFKFDLSSLLARIQTNNEVFTHPNLEFVCLPDPVVFQNLSAGGETYVWDFGDGETLTVTGKKPIVHHYANPGKYTVKLRAADRATCKSVDSTAVVVDVFRKNMSVGPDATICFGSSYRLEATGAANYSWVTIDSSYTSNEATPLVSPTDSTVYYLTMVDANGCMEKDTVRVDVVPGVDLKFDYEKIYDCENRPYVKVRNLSELKDGERATFLLGDGSTSEDNDFIHKYEQDGIYTIALRSTKEFCVYEQSEDLRFITVKVPNVITPGSEDGLNDTFKVLYGDPPWPKDDVRFNVKIINRWGVPVFESTRYNDDWKGTDVDPGIYYFEVDLVGEVKCKGWVHLVK